MQLYLKWYRVDKSQMLDYYQGMRRKISIPTYLGGGPFSTCPFSTIAFSGKSPLSVLTTFTGPLSYELLDDELEPVLGLGTGEAGGAFPPCLGSIGGEYDPPLCRADELGLLGGVGGTTEIGHDRQVGVASARSSLQPRSRLDVETKVGDIPGVTRKGGRYT